MSSSILRLFVLYSLFLILLTILSTYSSIDANLTPPSPSYSWENDATTQHFTQDDPSELRFGLLEDLSPIRTLTISFPKFTPSHILSKLDQQQLLHQPSSADFFSSSDVDITAITAYDVELLQQFPPRSDNDPRFTPFGPEMTISLEVNGETLSYQLQLDTTPISTTPSQPTEIDGIGYMTHSSYKGERVLENGKTEVIVVTVTPIVAHSYYENSSSTAPRHETQSVKSTSPFIQQGLTTLAQVQNSRPTTLSFDILSGRNNDMFTIEGTILQPDGEMYYITSVTGLAYHTENHIETSIQNMVKIEQDSALLSDPTSEAFVNQQISTLSSHISTLATQFFYLQELQQQTQYDLVIYKASRSPFDTHKGCGTQPHHHDGHNLNDQNSNISTLEMTPFWSFSRWQNCHQHDDASTSFFIIFYTSYSFTAWTNFGASSISVARTAAYIQYILQQSNLPAHQQLGVSFKAYKINVAAKMGSQSWNPNSPSDLRCSADAEKFLKFFATVRSGTTTEHIAAQHFLLNTCNSQGVVGINYLNCGCRISNSAGLASYTSIDSWITVIHELGHGIFGLNHPFEKTDTTCFNKEGGCGGIMDYNYNALPDTVDGARKYGFNSATDSGEACSTLRTVFARTSSMDNYVPPSSCFITPSNTNAGLCGNGIIDPFEECDIESPCCHNCKLVTGATCDGLDPQCCDLTTCLDKINTLCNLEIDGVSRRLGYCTKGHCRRMDYAVPETCPDDIIMPFQCAYTTPDSTCAATNKGILYQPGTACTPSDKIRGICIRTQPFQFPSNPMSCQELTPDSYSWQYSLIEKCSCLTTPYKQTTEAYICVNPVGATVSESYCAHLIKPPGFTCDCPNPDFRYKWEYTEWSNCGLSECDVGLQSRSPKCMKCPETDPMNCIEATVSNDCYVAVGPPIISRMCVYTPPVDQECGNGSSNAFTCEINTDTTTTLYSKCVCKNGYGGAFCRIAPEVSNLLVETNDGSFVEFEQAVRMNWAWQGYANAMLSISMLYADTTAVVTSNILATSGSAYFTLPSPTNAGTTSIVLRVSLIGTNMAWSTPSILAYSFSYVPGQYGACYGNCGNSLQTRAVTCTRSDLAPAPNQTYCKHLTMPTTQQACANGNDTCNVHGLCLNNFCVCHTGYSGPLCASTSCSLCDDKGTDSCDLVNTNGECVCKSNYMGKQCENHLDQACNVDVANKCANSGFITRVNDDTCQDTCTCQGNWINSPTPVPTTTLGCGTCPLTCRGYNNLNVTGTYDPSMCTNCRCNDGFYGNNCQCREIFFTIQFEYAPTSYFTEATYDDALVNATTIDLNKQMIYLATIRSQYSLISGIPLEQITIPTWRRVKIEGNRQAIKLNVTASVKLPCDQTNLLSSINYPNSDVEDVYTKIALIIDRLHIKATYQNTFPREYAPIGSVVINLKTALYNTVYDPACDFREFSSTAKNTCVSNSQNNNPFPSSTDNDEINMGSIPNTNVYLLVVVVVFTVLAWLC